MRMDSVSKANETQPIMSTKVEPKETTKEETKVETKVETKKETDEKSETNQVTIDQEKLKRLVQQLKENVPNTEPKFGIHEATNRMMVKLVDKDTQEVIREFPLEKTLDSIAKTLDIAGAMVDEKL